MERFARPIVVVGCHEGSWIGSGRSIAAYNITEGMRAAGEGMLTRAGGHVQACGFALSNAEHLSRLAESLAAHAKTALGDRPLVPTLECEVDISLEAVDMSLTEAVEALAPFGEGNRRPMFISRNIRIVAIDLIGSTKNHLRLTLVTPRGRRMKALGFKLGERAAEISIDKVIDLAYTLAINEWNGQRTAECRIIDLHVCI